MSPAWPPSNAEDLTAFHEGRKAVPYYDQFGFPTCGIGHKLSNEKYAPLSQWPIATDEQIDAWFQQDRAAAAAECQRIFDSAWDGFGDARQAAFEDMAFELGEAGLGAFHETVQAAIDGDWAACATFARQSLWDRQVPHRAAHDEALIRTGDWGALARIAA